MASGEKDFFAEAFKKMGFTFIEETCVFHYTDAPVSFIISTTWKLGLIQVDEHYMVPGLVRVVETASAMWKGKLMFFDGANLAFGAGTDVLTSDYCCN